MVFIINYNSLLKRNLVYGIEQQFEVEGSFLVIGLTEGEGGVALWGALGVEHLVGKGLVGTDVEGVLFAEVGHRGIEQEL